MEMYHTEINEYKKGIYDDDLATASDLENSLPQMNIMMDLIAQYINRIRSYRWKPDDWKYFLDSFPEGLVTNTVPENFDICREVITNQAIGYVVLSEFESNMPLEIARSPSVWSFMR